MTLVNLQATSTPDALAPVLLSVLIPSYRYPEGVNRILQALKYPPPGQLEIIVFDDSPDESVRQTVAIHQKSGVLPIRYQQNHPPKGAARNWNALLDEASGEYCWLVHHDEFPLNESFIPLLLSQLKSNTETDVFLMDCWLTDGDGRLLRHHLPAWIRAWVLNKVPGYLFQRNVIGPTSCLVVRRKLYPRFNENLRWLVDVDLYVRLRHATNRWLHCNQLKMGSLQGHTQSITQALSGDLAQIEQSERDMLRPLYPSAARWLHPHSHSLSIACERTIWFMMRVVTRIWALLSRQARLQFENKC
jgi:glycosyltransferase involved in cell wall biosynthesis